MSAASTVSLYPQMCALGAEMKARGVPVRVFLAGLLIAALIGVVMHGSVWYLPCRPWVRLLVGAVACSLIAATFLLGAGLLR